MEKIGSFITGLVSSVIGFYIGFILAILLGQTLSIQEPFSNYLSWFLNFLGGISLPLLIRLKIKVDKNFYRFGILVGLTAITILFLLVTATFKGPE